MIEVYSMDFPPAQNWYTHIMRTSKSDSDAINLQERDLALLRGLFESRIMTAGHISALYFDRKREATKKRLQKIKAAGLIGERKRRVNEPSILFLTGKAFALLQQHGELSGFPPLGPLSFQARARVSDLTIRHELEVMDVKAAFYSAIAKTSRFKIAEFSTWPLLYQFEATRAGYDRATVLVKPDGFIRIHEKEEDGSISEHTFFLEVDRSSETQATLVSRAGLYVDYYRSGGFAVRNGASAANFQEYPFRVLMVFKTAERRNNTAERLLQNNPPIFNQVWLSTIEEVARDPLGPIWIQPYDYREVTTGTIFDTECQTKAVGYRRQNERDAFVETRIRKMQLLNE